jgi:hypothetical protein
MIRIEQAIQFLQIDAKTIKGNEQLVIDFLLQSSEDNARAQPQEDEEDECVICL